MAGTWTATCPKGGVYAGEGHYVKKGEGIQLHLKKVVKIKAPKGESCEGNPHSEPTCKKRKSCIKKVELKCCGKTTKDYSKCDCNPIAVCRATVPCP